MLKVLWSTLFGEKMPSVFTGMLAAYCEDEGSCCPVVLRKRNPWFNDGLF